MGRHAKTSYHLDVMTDAEQQVTDFKKLIIRIP